MLTKLMKYDIRSTWRDFAGVYMTILLGVIIVPLLINNIGAYIANTLAGLLMASIIIGTIVITVISLFNIFNTNVFSKEGYLTMTLPVTSRQLVLSKLLVSTMWIILTGIVSLIGLVIFFAILSPIPGLQVMAGLEKIHSLLDGGGYVTAALIILVMIASVVKEISKLFLACTIGHLKQLNRFRVPVAIASYFAFAWVESLIVRILGTAVSYLPQSAELARQLRAVTDPGQLQDFAGVFNGMIVAGILFALLISFLYGLGTVWLLNHKLDLD